MIFLLILLVLTALWVVCGIRLFKDRAGWFAELYFWLGVLALAYLLSDGTPAARHKEQITALVFFSPVAAAVLGAIAYSFWTCPPDWLKRRGWGQAPMSVA